MRWRWWWDDFFLFLSFFLFLLLSLFLVFPQGRVQSGRGLALTHSSSSLIVRVAEWYKRFFRRLADYHHYVTYGHAGELWSRTAKNRDVSVGGDNTCPPRFLQGFSYSWVVLKSVILRIKIFILSSWPIIFAFVGARL